MGLPEQPIAMIALSSLWLYVGVRVSVSLPHLYYSLSSLWGYVCLSVSVSPSLCVRASERASDKYNMYKCEYYSE